jgi:hypothetical protein
MVVVVDYASMRTLSRNLFRFVREWIRDPAGLFENDVVTQNVISSHFFVIHFVLYEYLEHSLPSPPI